MFDMLKWLYDGGKGKLTINGLVNAVIKGWITEAQKQEIIGTIDSQ
ncbi:MAG TPA: XkdX family protein [Lachnoclostridium sp.]|uniref:XkdX-like protein n=1 Tax=[Clostridium] celerecrescens 18A TaxID=1286362 RepID=A0A2M8Z2Z0_9FIRM|nr:XkdX family protein [Lacrimispora celerecrescens]PJJ27814.1 XkdX-like protein [[Clostridium] celerecrescens 18A]HBD00188.1 XkdX family protein [Lachnoclostridium sp.]